jgi:hypothetical protein
MLPIFVALVWLAQAALFASLCRIAAYGDIEASGTQEPVV